jgi:hypothetical protein
MWQLVSFKNNTALHPITDTTFIWTDEIKIFIFGLFSDVLSYTRHRYLVAVFNFHIKRKYLKPYGYIIFWLFVALFLYIARKIDTK